MIDLVVQKTETAIGLVSVLCAEALGLVGLALSFEWALALV